MCLFIPDAPDAPDRICPRGLPPPRTPRVAHFRFVDSFNCVICFYKDVVSLSIYVLICDSHDMYISIYIHIHISMMSNSSSFAQIFNQWEPICVRLRQTDQIFGAKLAVPSAWYQVYG